MRRRFGPYEEVNVAIAALVLGGPESVRVVCFTAAAVNVSCRTASRWRGERGAGP